MKLVKDNLNGTEVHNIDGYDFLESTTPMWEQVSGIRDKMLPTCRKPQMVLTLYATLKASACKHQYCTYT